MSYEIPYEPADIIFHVPGKGIVLKEKSLIAIQKADNRVVAVGTEVERIAVKDAFLMATSEVLIADVPAEEFIRENCEKSPKLYQKYKVIIDIAKDDPERYVEERLRDILAYAAREKISSDKMCTLLQKLGLRQTQDLQNN